jgi:two-component system nitrogen regulation response regulator GlnG
MTDHTSSSPPIVLVDDEPQLLRSASMVLRNSGIEPVRTVADSREVLSLLDGQPVGLLVLDLTMPHLSGEALLTQVAETHPEVPVIVMTGSSDLKIAVRCMKLGAIDYLLKPVDADALVAAVRRGLEMRALRMDVSSLRDSLLSDGLRQPEAFADIVTQSKVMLPIFRYVEALAKSASPVLITGESGTGKNLIAKALHRLSGRPGDLVEVNVAGLDDAFFSDTLFGHHQGAFTGAQRARAGKVSIAGHGTLFLDEIGDLTSASQAKLLQLLQDGSYEPIGAERPQRCHARIVAATHHDLAADVAANRFRNDLYYRANTHRVRLPPLRERDGDIPLLVRHFVEMQAHAAKKPVPTIPESLLQLLGAYSWMGNNVRELEGMCADAVARHQGGVLSSQSFKEKMTGQSIEREAVPGNGKTAAWLPDPLPTLKEANRLLIDAAMDRAGGNQGVAAGILGMTRQALNKRMARQKQTDVDPDDED